MRPYIPILLFIFISCHSKQSDNNTSENVLPQTSTKTDTIANAETTIISERIDGPANIRDSVNGRLLFTLNDHVAVAATAANGKWLQVGILVDLTKEQMDSLRIYKGSKILAGGKEVGRALEDIHLSSTSQSIDGPQGDLRGYTAVSNIKPNTVVENVFSSLVNTSSGALTKKRFNRFLHDFEFRDFEGLLPRFKGFEIDENWIDDPSPLLRLWLIFDGDTLYGVFHSRPFHLNGARIEKVERGFYFSTFSQDQKTNEDLINAFNAFISQVD